MNNNYVYVYVDPTKPGNYEYPNINLRLSYEPYYVGKGKLNRMLCHIAEAKLKIEP